MDIMTSKEEAEILPDRDGIYPVGYVPDGPLQRGALYRIENNGIRMYPPGTSAYYQKKARERWEAERMEIYGEHKFEWLAAFLSDTTLPDINDSLKFNQHPTSNSSNPSNPSYSNHKQAWLWVLDKFKHDQEIINKVKSDRNVNSVSCFFDERRKHQFKLR